MARIQDSNMDTSEKSDEMNDFYLIISSNSSLNFHRNNNASCFIAELPKQLVLKGNWEVALHEFSFVYTPYQSLSKSTIRYSRHSEATITRTVRMNRNEVNMKEKDDIVTIDVVNHPKPCIVISIDSDMGGDKGFTIMFNNRTDARKLGFTKIENSTKTNGLLSENAYLPNTDDIEVKIKYHPFVSERITFNENLDFSTLKDIGKYIKEAGSDIFSTCEFDENDIFKFSVKNDIKSISFDASLVSCLGLRKENYDFEGPEVFEGERKGSVTEMYYNMLIYSNIVNPIIVGDSHVPLLKSVWINGAEPNELVKVIIKRPMYLETSRSLYDSIEINIRDDAGEFIKFASNTHTSLTLHFRPDQSE